MSERIVVVSSSYKVWLGLDETEVLPIPVIGPALTGWLDSADDLATEEALPGPVPDWRIDKSIEVVRRSVAYLGKPEAPAPYPLPPEDDRVERPQSIHDDD
jgi:hypothetical protein